MTYLILPKDSEPFTTDWFDAENNYVEGMIVFDLVNWSYTTDGKNWKYITFDHL